MSASSSAAESTRQLRRSLEHALVGVEGWLWLDEAWELHEAARLAPTRGETLVAEIGSFKGRSTIAMALGLQARGKGSVLAIDPFDMEPDQKDAFLSNIERAGVRHLVSPVQAYSHDARPRVGDASLSLLFVDGSHEYVDVLQDVNDWRTALAHGAVVAFNDPYWEGVSRALAESIAIPRTPFRNPRWVLNSLFVDYLPEASWTTRDEVMRRRLRAFLALGRRWLRFHDRLVARKRVPLWIKQLALHAGRLLFRAVLPIARTS